MIRRSIIWILPVSTFWHFCRYSCHLVVSLFILENLSCLCNIKNNNNKNELGIFQISSFFLSHHFLSHSQNIFCHLTFLTLQKHCMSYLKPQLFQTTYLNLIISTFSKMFLWQQKYFYLFNVRKKVKCMTRVIKRMLSFGNFKV